MTTKPKRAARQPLTHVALPIEARAQLEQLIGELKRSGIGVLPAEAKALVPTGGSPFTAGWVVGYACAIARRRLSG